LHHDFEGLAPTDVGQGDREAPALADDVRRGIDMEVAGATPRLAAVDLLGIVEVRPVIGDEEEVNGQRLGAAAQGLGQVAG